MGLLDNDRFEGKYREGVHETDASDLMRRLVKEQLLRFDGSHLFPERRAYTVAFKLSTLEAALYQTVTSYVREEFTCAENLDKERKGTVGFALTVLQRRLASSPEAIYQSLHRRRERLESRLRELRLQKRGAEIRIEWEGPLVAEEDVLDDLATAARTIDELGFKVVLINTYSKLNSRRRTSYDS
jgi:hypothetical protein